MHHLTTIVFASAAARLSAARSRALAALAGGGQAGGGPLLIVAPTRSAADEFAFSLAAETGATFGVTRSSVAEIVVRTAIPALAAKGLTPSAPLSAEAVSARVTDDLMTRDGLKYFAPVAGMPGFPRALSRTLGELRMAGVSPSALSRGPALSERSSSQSDGLRESKGHDANDDLAALSSRAAEERERSGAVDYATMLETAAAELKKKPAALGATTVVLLT